MTAVVGLRGGAVPGSRDPDQEVIDDLEKLLEHARDGHLRGIAYAAIYDEKSTTSWAGRAAMFKFLSGTALLNYRVAKAVDET